jgi:hypothetical protein
LAAEVVLHARAAGSGFDLACSVAADLGSLVDGTSLCMCIWVYVYVCKSVYAMFTFKAARREAERKGVRKGRSNETREGKVHPMK